MLIGGAINLGFQALTGNIHSFGDGLKAFGVGAIAGLAGGATSGIITGTGFMAGAASGAITGFAAGFSGSVLNSYISGAGFSQILSSGLKGGLLGAGSGALIGGVIQGVESVRHGGNFFTGNGYRKTSEIGGQSGELGGTLEDSQTYLDRAKSDMNYRKDMHSISEIEMAGYDFYLRGDKNIYTTTHNNAIIESQSIETGLSHQVGGFEFAEQVSWKMKSSIYLSPHTTEFGLRLALNHELIHAYHSITIKNNNHNMSEVSAYTYNLKTDPSWFHFRQINKFLNLSGAKYANIMENYKWPNFLVPIR